MRNKFLLHAAVASLALLAGTAVHAQTYSNAVVTLNPPPVGYWPLQEATQPPTPGSFNFTAHNSGTLGTAGDGLYGAWYQADGASWYLTNNVVLTNANYTGDGSKALLCQSVGYPSPYPSTNYPGQYVVVPHTTNGVLNDALTIKPPFSVECWAYIGSTNSAARVLVAQGTTRTDMGGSDPNNQFNGGTTNGMAGFELLQYQDYISFMTCATNTWAKNSFQSSAYNTWTGFKVGQLVHIVVTMDTAGKRYMYTNGVQCKTPDTATANAAGLRYVPDTVSPIMIGAGPEVSVSRARADEDVYSPYSGVLDEVAIYPSVLTAAQAQAHYQAAANGTYSSAVQADSPMLYYRFDDSIAPANAGYNTASFPTANNYGREGANANGLYQPGTTPGVAGPTYAGFGANSRAVALNGAFGTVNIGNGNLPVSLNPTGAVPLTVVSWFKGGPADSPNRFQEIVGHGDNSYRLGLGWSGGKQLGTNVGHHFNAGPGPELQFANTKDETINGFALNDGKWHMVAGVSDGINVSMYLDGRLAKTASNPAGINILGSTNDLVLGGDPQYTYASGNAEYTIRNYSGSIAHVAFWTNALSQAQIQQLYGAAGVPPTIVQQPPASTNVNAGSPLVVPVVARGAGTLTYQWYRNGSPYSGQTTSALSLNPVSLSDAGTYRVRVTDLGNSTDSTDMVLTVNGPPVLADQSPTDIKVYTGTRPVLHATANGPTPISYQWYKGGSPISGATQSAYTLSSTTDTASVGSSSYSCTITNSYGALTTTFRTITVQVLPKPVAPYPAQVLADNPAYFFTLDEADQGYPNAGLTAYDYAGGCNAVYTNTSLSQPGYVVSDPGIDSTNTAALFGFNDNDSFAGKGSRYLDFSTPAGNNAQFSVEAWIKDAYAPSTDAGLVTVGYGYGGEQFALECGGRGAGNLRALRFLFNEANGTGHSVTAPGTTNILQGDYTWHHVVGVCDQAGGKLSLYVDGVLQNSTAISAGTGLKALTAPLSIGSRLYNSASTAYTNQFQGWIDNVALYNVALSSNQVVNHFVAAGVAPIFVQVPPATLTTNAGATVALSVTVLGTSPLTFQWMEDWNDIPGATTSTLTLNNVVSTVNPHVYAVRVNSPYGSVNSPSTTLIVNAGPPSFTVDLAPLLATNYVGRSFTYSVVCGGSVPFTYQWYQDGSLVANATNASYSFTTLSNQHSYYVHVGNREGVANSSTATLWGQPVPTLNPADYSCKATVTFSGYTRTEVLTNFPALVLLTNIPGLSYSQFADPNGGDLRFTDASGQLIPHEMDEWNPAGTSAVWVRVPRLTSTNDFIMAYWGNPAATTPLAWSTNGSVWVAPSWEGQPPYLAVYHLKESALPFADSTLQFPATNGVVPTPGAGIVASGGLWSTGGYLTPGPITNIDGAFTLSAWVNISPSVNDIQTIFSEKLGGWDANGFALFVNSYQTHDGMLRFETGGGPGVGGDASYSAAGAVSFGQWHLLTAVVNKNANQAHLYVDATDVTSKGVTFNGFATTNGIYLGRGLSGSFSLQGTMDETRIRTGTDSAGWVWADYMTVAQNTTFEKYGPAVVTAPPTLTARVVGSNLVLTWSAGTLIGSTSLSTPVSQWQPVTGAVSPYTIPLASIQSGARYFRAKQ